MVRSDILTNPNKISYNQISIVPCRGEVV